MQEEKQHHHQNLFQYRKEEEKAPVKAVVFSETAYGVDGAGKLFETTETVSYATTKPVYEKEGNGYLRKEHLGELGSVAPGSFGLYEKHQAKKNEVHNYRNKIEEEMAKAVAVGAGGYTFREHHQKKET